MDCYKGEKMKLPEAKQFFEHYKPYIENGTKITIHYDKVKEMVEAYEVIEKETALLTKALLDIHKRSVNIIAKDPNTNRDTLFLIKIEETCTNTFEQIELLDNKLLDTNDNKDKNKI
jgi:hypothetical protein